MDSSLKSRLRVVVNVFLAVMVVLGVRFILAGLLDIDRSRDGECRRPQCVNNLRRISLALLCYKDAHNYYCRPTEKMFRDDGMPRPSWRVVILPYLDCQDLYSQLDLKKPWDDPANAKVRNADMPVFRCVNAKRNTKCNYVAITGPGTVWPMDGKTKISADYVSAHDGCSNTLLLVEVADGLADWSEPKDLSLEELCDPQNKEKTLKLFSVHNGGLVVAFCDGHIQFMRAETLLKNLRALATCDGGENLDEIDLY